MFQKMKAETESLFCNNYIMNGVMKKTVTLLTVFLFVTGIYILPAADAITLGEIKSENGSSNVKDGTGDQDKKAPVKSDDITKDKKGEEKRDKKRELKKEVNPRLVCLLSVIMPGGGHFYMNNDAKGMSFCLAAGAGYTLTGFFMIKTMLADRGSVAYKNYILLTGFLFFITLVIHFVGIIEAYSDADEINKKNLFESEADNPYSINVINGK